MKRCWFLLLSLFALLPASAQTRPSPQRPNILFAISDDQSYAHTSFSQCPFVNTPAFDQVAREGVFFTNCIAGSPGCAPSRSSIVTGRYPWQNEQSGQHGSAWMKKYVPLVDVLAQSGYHTGYTGKGVDPFQYAGNDKESLWRKGNAAGKSYGSIRYGTQATADPRTAKGIGNTDYFLNFKDFLSKRNNGQPFFFWYGATEPHRGYEKDSWMKNRKQLKNAVVPAFLPDNGVVRGDLLDYAVEIEWFDYHLQQMLQYLKETGELENTIVIVTSDNGMAFPRAKANSYEYGIHVPFAIRFPKKFPAGTVIDNPVSFVDIAPTLLELTGTPATGMQAITGTSILKKMDAPTDAKDMFYAYSGRERHSSSRYMNWGYPQRAIRSKDYLLIWNMKPERWPAGAPQSLNSKNKTTLLPLYGIDGNGKHHADWAFTDIDGSPTKTFIIEHFNDELMRPYFEWATMKRPEYELYDIVKDPACLQNLAGRQALQATEVEMKKALQAKLIETKDPRVVGPDKEIFDSYERHVGPARDFPDPAAQSNSDH